jgi:hypothetical protein
MRKLLVIILIVAIWNLSPLEDDPVKEIENGARSLDKPDSKREVLYIDWDNLGYVYKDQENPGSDKSLKSFNKPYQERTHNYDQVYVDEDLSNLWNTFARELISHGYPRDYLNDFKDITIKFNRDLALDGNVGHCRREGGKVVISIEPTWWYENYHLYYLREAIFFHECGHCFLNRGHDDRENSFGRAASIMHTEFYQYKGYYAQNREYYLKELFKTK